MDLRPILTENMRFDIYWEMFSGGDMHHLGEKLMSDYEKSQLELDRLQRLSRELAKLDVFLR